MSIETLPLWRRVDGKFCAEDCPLLFSGMCTLFGSDTTPLQETGEPRENWHKPMRTNRCLSMVVPGGENHTQPPSMDADGLRRASDALVDACSKLPKMPKEPAK